MDGGLGEGQKLVESSKRSSEVEQRGWKEKTVGCSALALDTPSPLHPPSITHQGEIPSFPGIPPSPHYHRPAKASRTVFSDPFGFPSHSSIHPGGRGGGSNFVSGADKDCGSHENSGWDPKQTQHNPPAFLEVAAGSGWWGSGVVPSSAGGDIAGGVGPPTCGSAGDMPLAFACPPAAPAIAMTKTMDAWHYPANIQKGRAVCDLHDGAGSETLFPTNSDSARERREKLRPVGGMEVCPGGGGGIFSGSLPNFWGPVLMPFTPPSASQQLPPFNPEEVPFGKFSTMTPLGNATHSEQCHSTGNERQGGGLGMTSFPPHALFGMPFGTFLTGMLSEDPPAFPCSRFSPALQLFGTPFGVLQTFDNFGGKHMGVGPFSSVFPLPTDPQ